jgi:hypothetical protein
MNRKGIGNSMRRQKGAATLVITLIVLVLITIITLFTGRSMVTEQRVSANQYRTEQAEVAARAALDLGVALIDRWETGAAAKPLGVDRNGDGNATGTSPDETIIRSQVVLRQQVGGVWTLVNAVNNNPISEANPFEFFVTDPASGHSVRARLWYRRAPDLNDTDCAADSCTVADAANCTYLPVVGKPSLPIEPQPIPVRVCAEGLSDDGTARHRMTVLVGQKDLGGSGRPKLPLTAYAMVNTQGGGTIVNWVTNDNVWTGQDVAYSGTPGTFIRNPAMSPGSCPGGVWPSYPCCLSDLGSETNGFIKDYMLAASNSSIGTNADIIDNDPNIAALTEDGLWALFFGSLSRSGLKDMAKEINQVYTGTAPPDGTTGVIWVEGNLNLSSATIGTLESPAVVIVNGNLDVSGNTTINGFLYVTGKMGNSTGTNRVNGVLAVEDDAAARSGSSTSVGKMTGATEICFDPPAGTGEDRLVYGTVAVIPGSWRDWNLF